MAAWDRHGAHAQHKLRDALIREQLRDSVGPFSPFWRERLTALRITPSSIHGANDLPKLPAVGERDLCPDGDPAKAARLVLQADEHGFALHSHGPDLRKAIVRRLAGKASYRRQVEAAIRPTTYHWAGQGFTFPVASTRGDLDLIARAGNRAWQVLGLGPSDVLVSALPVAQRLDHQFLSLAALAAGAPALFPLGTGAGAEDVVAALRLVPATVLAVPAASAAATIAGLVAAGGDLSRLTRVLLVGAPDAAARAAASDALAAAGARATALALYGPGEGRVLWAECAPGSGFHTYPDLDVVELIAPDSGEPSPNGGEITVTQLGFRGSALLRWRTGDVVDEPLGKGHCPGCQRTVPRVPSGVHRSGLVAPMSLRGARAGHVDLRSVAGALSGRPDLLDWRIETGQSARDGSDELVVVVVTSGDETEAAVGVYQDVRSAAGISPTQVVVLTAAEFDERVSTRSGLRKKS